MSEVAALRERIFALEVYALAHKELVQDLLNENDYLKKTFDTEPAKLIDYDDEPRRGLSNAALVGLTESYDGVSIGGLRQWQTRAVAAEQSVREAQVSMVSVSCHSCSVFLPTGGDFKQSHNFVLALIDGNTHSFPFYLLRKGTQGGAEAADCLLAEIKSHIQGWSGANNWKILVRVYVDVEGLLRNSRGPLKSLGHWDIIQFAQGFSQRQPFFDYVDTGKLAIDRKLEVTFAMFINNIQCQHIIYGCRLEYNSLRVLASYRANVLHASRISLLGASQAGLQSPFETIDLITAMASGIPLNSLSERDDAFFGDFSTSSSIEHQSPLTDRSSITTLDDISTASVYRFLDRQARRKDHTDGDDSGLEPRHFSSLPPPSNTMPISHDPALATKTWDPRQNTVLLNVKTSITNGLMQT